MIGLLNGQYMSNWWILSALLVQDQFVDVGRDKSQKLLCNFELRSISFPGKEIPDMGP